MRLIDLRGQRFGRLVVVRRAYTDGQRRYWEAVCDCGKVVIVQGHNLKSGRTQSCGCLRRRQPTPAVDPAVRHPPRLYEQAFV